MSSSVSVIEPGRNPYRVQKQAGLVSPVGASNAAVEIEQQRAVAEVMAAMTLAKRFPRDPVRSVDRILDECSKPALANQSQYAFARGGTEITGPSIRLAEVLARCWGNIQTGIAEVSRSNGESNCVAFAWDLETNVKEIRPFIVRHWRDTKSGGYALKDERDINELVANQGSRRKRQAILALIPGDVVDAAIDQCDETLKLNVEITQETVSGLIKAFDGLGVSKAQIEKRIQRRIDTILPAQYIGLRKVWKSISDGMSTPDEWFEAAASTGEERMAALKQGAQQQTEGKPVTETPAAALAPPTDQPLPTSSPHPQQPAEPVMVAQQGTPSLARGRRNGDKTGSMFGED